MATSTHVPNEAEHATAMPPEQLEVFNDGGSENDVEAIRDHSVGHSASVRLVHLDPAALTQHPLSTRIFDPGTGNHRASCCYRSAHDRIGTFPLLLGQAP